VLIVFLLSHPRFLFLDCVIILFRVSAWNNDMYVHSALHLYKLNLSAIYRQLHNI